MTKNKIHIKKSKRGTFTKAAKKRGMSVQAFAKLVLANRNKYSSEMVKKANFAHNAANWKKEEGGDIKLSYQNQESNKLPEGWKWMKEGYKNNDLPVLKKDKFKSFFNEFIKNKRKNKLIKNTLNNDIDFNERNRLTKIQQNQNDFNNTINLQSGGDFPNASSYNQLGSTSNKIHYKPSTLNNKVGRPVSILNNQRLFQSGGSIDVNLIDKNDILHPSDSDNLSYRNNPVGISMTIKKQYQSPLIHLSNPQVKNVNSNVYKQGGNIAETEEEFSQGLNKGVNVFEFPRKGLKKMTMNPESGPIEYPVDYEGFTDGKKTDQGTANPGDEFTVNGDTVVEYPNLSDMDFNKAFEYALQKKLPIFRWNGKEYPIEKNMKMQEGGLFSNKVTNKVKLDPGFKPDENI